MVEKSAIRCVHIEWVDSKTWSNAWMDKDDLILLKLPHCTSEGRVLKEDSESIFLYQSNSEGEYLNIIGIPKACIKQLKELGETA